MKFTKTDYFFFFFSLILSGVGMLQPINPIFGYILVIIGIFGMAWVLIKSFRRKQDNVINSSVENLQTLFGRIANLYNQTAIFIQQSFNLQQPSSGHKAQSLHREFEEFMDYKNDITLSIPQEIGLATMSFFDLLSDYKNQAYIIINSSKTNKSYDRWLDLKQRFDVNIAPLYSKLEVQFRQLLNKTPHN